MTVLERNKCMVQVCAVPLNKAPIWLQSTQPPPSKGKLARNHRRCCLETTLRIRLMQWNSIYYVIRRCQRMDSKDCLPSCCDLLKLWTYTNIVAALKRWILCYQRKLNQEIDRKDQRTQSPNTAFERKFVSVVEFKFRKMVSSLWLLWKSSVEPLIQHYRVNPYPCFKREASSAHNRLVLWINTFFSMIRMIVAFTPCY